MSSFCDSVPLHTIQTIQPHGVLFVLSLPALEIVQASANAPVLLSAPLSQLLGSRVDELLDAPGLSAALRAGEDEFILDARLRGRPPVSLWAHLHRSGPFLIAELEPVQDQPAAVLAVLRFNERLRTVIRSVGQGRDIADTCAIAALEIRAMTGFERVMIYRFDSDGCGTVVGEEATAGMERYLGLKFPASDVPAQVRALYRQRPLRHIADITAPPVPLVPDCNPVSGAPTDLSRALLRAVPQVHVEYLHNMQVRAATSVAILRDGALWGLIACHHRSARPVAPDQRAALELLGVVLAAHLGEVESRHATTRLARSVAALEQICERLRAARSLRVGLLEQMAPLMALFEADGAVLQLDRQLDRRGAVPSRPEVMALLELVLQGQQELFATDCLAAHLADARSHAQIAAGLLALRISREAGDCLLLFRREWARTVAWAGDPGSAIEFDADGRQYHPRRSFRIWQESVTERSRPWDEVTLDTGRRLRQRLLELALYAQEMRVRALSGMFPICAWCKKVRGHDDQWYSVDAYLMRHTDAVVTHSMCPACLDAFA